MAYGNQIGDIQWCYFMGFTNQFMLILFKCVMKNTTYGVIKVSCMRLQYHPIYIFVRLIMWVTMSYQ